MQYTRKKGSRGTECEMCRGYNSMVALGNHGISVRVKMVVVGSGHARDLGGWVGSRKQGKEWEDKKSIDIY